MNLFSFGLSRAEDYDLFSDKIAFIYRSLFVLPKIMFLYFGYWIER
jgi:hypothetical protein